MNKIEGFFGKHRFLSNFHLESVVYKGIKYPTNEHAYQAAKSLDPIVREEISKIVSPRDARRAGQKVKCREDFDEIKISVMEEINRIKFQVPYLAKLLKETGDAYLEETNWWKDVFWGVCDGVGQNNLGKILMKIRDEK